MKYFINKELSNVRLYVLFSVGFVKKIERETIPWDLLGQVFNVMNVFKGTMRLLFIKFSPTVVIRRTFWLIAL